MQRVKIGVIGCGSIGKIHIANLKKIESAEVVAACDIDEEELKRVREEFGVERLYKDYRDLLAEEDIDGVIVATPNRWHSIMTIEALRSGKHVLCEKPPAITAKEVQEMYNASKKYGRGLLIGLGFRFMSQSQALKKLVEEGVLGEAYYSRALFLRRSGIPGMGSWFTRKKDAGAGALYDIGVHALDLALWLMGDFKAKEVWASTFAKFGPYGRGLGGWGKPVPGGIFDVDDFATVYIKMQSGAVVYLEVSWAAFVPEDVLDVIVLGDKGGLEHKTATVFTERAGVRVNMKLQYQANQPLVDELKHFVKIIAKDEDPLTKPEEMIWLQAILEAALRSAEKGEVVEVESLLF
ncbi:MAG: gfo/Idh/MocA family oxidoreductase [Thermoprotei archaeon]|nr:MAG: gfo/Idh/MocA family oxidoreductase [Thermoprotei archaeon]RLF03437.1 MAG: gfo/Idh/MocA family oxidoreductase [Thermoprotei archaeon]